MTSISESLKQIPSKKAALKKSFENLQLHSSALSTFTLQWKDLEDHFSSIESSIQLRFNSLPNHLTQTKIPTLPSEADPKFKSFKIPTLPSEADPKRKSFKIPTLPSEADPKLKSFCVDMDHISLRNHIYYISVTTEELATALAFAPDPALLVLESMYGFYPFDNSTAERRAKAKARRMENGETNVQRIRTNCIKLLEGLYLIGGEFKEKIEGVKEKAKEVAEEWKGKIPSTGDNALQVMGFLQLLASYGLVKEFEVDEVMAFLICVCKRKQAVGLIKPLGLEDKCHVLIEKLKSLGRQYDAVKMVYSLNLVDKYPPVPLLKAFVNEAKNKARDMRKKGNHSWQAMNEADAKEIAALRSVLIAIEEYELDSEYPREEILKRIVQLEEQMKAKKKMKQATTTVTASKSKTTPQNKRSKKRTALNTQEKKHQQQQPNKRSRPSPMTSAPAVAANPYLYPPLMIQSQSQLGLDDHARGPHMAMPRPYGAAPGHPNTSLYSPIRGQGVSSLSGAQLGGPLASPPPPRSYYHSVESLAGTTSLPPLVYERPVAYHGYDRVSDHRPPPYGSSLYR